MKVIPAQRIPIITLNSKVVLGYHTIPEHTEYETEEEIINQLFCGIKEEPCAITITMTDLSKRTSVVCDDVCELFGGPPTRWEIFKSELKFRVFKFKVFLKKNFHKHIWYTKTWCEAVVENNELLGVAHVKKVKFFDRWFTIRTTRIDYGNSKK